MVNGSNPDDQVYKEPVLDEYEQSALNARVRDLILLHNLQIGDVTGGFYTHTGGGPYTVRITGQVGNEVRAELMDYPGRVPTLWAGGV
jgi:hypothetical protein|tara:strand:- start:523 stop:786 length:264 start_codon:yes stop_codon:yes gene_type:complete